MKSIISIFIFSCLIISCSKTNTELSVNKEELSGEWLLKQYAGGIGYQVITPADKNVLKFDEAGKYTSAVNDTVEDKGNFQITTVSSDDDYYGSKTIINLFSDNNYKTTYGIRISNDSLFLREGYADGYVYTYVKQH